MGKKGKGKGKGKGGGCVQMQRIDPRPVSETPGRWPIVRVSRAQLAAMFTALALCFAAVSCTTLKDVIWPTTVKCLAAPSAAVVERVRAIVERDGLDAVFSSESLSALESAARDFGPDAVVCVLKELINAYTAPTGMEAPPDRMAAARRAQDFLNEHSIEVEEKSQ